MTNKSTYYIFNISRKKEQQTILMLLFFLFIFWIYPNQAFAQTQSRTELLRQKRTEKAKNLRAYQPKKMEKFLLTIENSQIPERIALGFWGFHPVFGGLKSGAGTQGGILYEPTKSLKNFQFSLKAVFSVRAYRIYQGIIGYEHERLSFYGYGQYQDSPQDDFYGIGPESVKQNRTNFRLKDANIGGVAELKLHRFVRTLFHISYLNNKIGKGTEPEYPSIEEVFQKENIPGLTRNVNYIIGKINFTFDSRNVVYPENFAIKHALSEDLLRHRAFNPNKGTYLSIQASRYKDQLHGQFDFKRLDFEFQQFISFYHGHQVIAFRHFSSLVDRDEKAEVPFYLMQPIGGSNSLRGYNDFRFRDGNALLFNAEYRWLVWTGLDMALFYDAGKVFPSAKDITLNNLKTSYGIGLRLNTSRSVILRLDIGRSKEGTLVHFQFNNVF